uniref:Fucolectin tachylectin-4 pentraxin-1 domain-containing protein n=1 Tax=Pygocentrus nattereri TaxID=42514 RepID=A0A3B4CR54_PYGNA
MCFFNTKKHNNVPCFECILFLINCHISLGLISKNLALYGKATQSSLVNNTNAAFSHAYNAIDGNTDSNYKHGSCTATETQQNPWWRVDLLGDYTVTSVTIYNRGDCCPEKINGAEIRIGNSLLNNGNNNTRAGVISSIPAGKSSILKLKGISGRYVNVIIPGNNRILTLCEVEVYGYPTPDVTLKGTASQSSLYDRGFPSNAIDGNQDGVYSHGSCSHTEKNLNAWWRLDLLKQHKVFTIRVTNRQELGHRLNGAEIRIGDSLDNNGNNNPRCGVINTKNNVLSFNCNGMQGRYINIVIPGRSEYLTLCEVEVYGVPLI